MRLINFCVLLLGFQYVLAEPIHFSYDAKSDSLTFTGEETLEQKHVKLAMAKYPRTKIVYVGGNISSVGYTAFKGCNNVETIIFSSSVKGNGIAPICECKKLSKVILPDDYRAISCFVTDCPSLESFVIPDSVRVIKELSLNCPFKNLHIGKNVQEIIGDFGIRSERLSSITVSPGNNLFFSQDGVLFSYYRNTKNYNPKDSMLKEISIVKYPPEKRDTTFTFNCSRIYGINNKYLKEIRLGKDCCGFSGILPSLSRIYVDTTSESFSVEENVLLDKTGNRLFAYPPAKTGKRYEIPSGVVVLEEFAFRSCQFDTLVFPESIKKVFPSAVYSCTKLQYVEMNWQDLNEVWFVADRPFGEINTANVTMKVPKGKKDLYIELFNKKMGYQFKVEE